MRARHWLALVPAVALVGAPWFANRVEPRVLGIPFLLAWIVGWVVASSLTLLLIDRLDGAGDTVDTDATAADEAGAHRGRMTLERWSVGNRRFGSLLVFLLLAGEIYTTFTFLGGSGWAYSRGAPAFYIIAYGTVAYLLSYTLLPAVWRRATAWRALSQADFFAHAYGSPMLGALVAVVSTMALIPYLVLQLRGLGIIVAETTYGRVPPNLAIVVGTLITVVYVMATGIGGSARVAAVKDLLVLVVVVGLGLALPSLLFGGIAPMFDRVVAERPGFLVLPSAGMSPSWFASTVLLTACGFYMWPHTFGSTFSARSATVFRRNAIVLPLYQLVLLFVFFIGFAALLTVPGLAGPNVDLALLRVVRAHFPPWIVGVVGVAGLLTALVPGSMILMASATMLARLLRVRAPLASVSRADGGVGEMRRARLLVPAIAAAALVASFRGGATLVALLLMGYSMVTQLFPPLVAALLWRERVTATAAMAGILAGEAVVLTTTLGGLRLPALLPGWPRALTDVNEGALAVLVNVIVLAVTSLVTRDTAPERGSGVIVEHALPTPPAAPSGIPV